MLQLRLLISHDFLNVFNFRSYLRVFSLYVGTNVSECVCMTVCVWAAVSAGFEPDCTCSIIIIVILQ